MLAQAEEEIAVGVTAGDRFGDRGERFVDLVLVFKTSIGHLDEELLALVDSGDTAVNRQARIAAKTVVLIAIGSRSGSVFLGRPEPQIGIVGQFSGPLPGPLGKIAFPVGL